MMSLEFIRTLPPDFSAALERKDFEALLCAAEVMAEKDASGTALALWNIAAHTDEIGALQVLSYSLVRRLTGPVAEACRLWLLLYRTEDLSTLVNVLSGLGALVVEGEGLADYHLAVLCDFLLYCLDHAASAVRISVLDFLRDYVAARGWPRRIGRTAARRLAEKIKFRLSKVVVEEEVAELKSVIAGLRSDEIPVKPTINLSQVNKLVTELEGNRDAAELATFVRVRRLYAHAQWQAQRDARPILTVRVIGGSNGDFLSRVRQIFDLCRLDNVDPTANVWLDAPAASLPKHLRARPETTKETFDRLRMAGAIADQTVGAVQELASVPPRQAEAVAKLLLEAGQSGVEAEFISTPADVGSAQLVLPLRRAASSMMNWSSAAHEAERVAAERPEVYSDEVPQANTVWQVLQAVDAMLLRGRVVIGDIDNVTTPRQINYYTQAARVLGFLDEDNAPTSRGRDLAGKTREERFAIAASAFEQSMVGRAWRAWTQARSLAAVDPQSAEAFLCDRARGISGSTVPRRASTLRGWQTELLPFYAP